MACDQCGEEFPDRRSEIEHVLSEHGDDISSHRADELKREKNRLAGSSDGGSFPTRAIAAGVMLLAVIGGGYALMTSGAVSFSSGGGSTPTGNAAIGETIHWHADYSISVCGEQKVLQDGPILAHTHGSTTFHLEGVRQRAEQATLDWIVDQLGGDFSNSSILAYEEPESCPGTDEPGELTVTVNGEEIADPEDYIVRNGDSIRITYG